MDNKKISDLENEIKKMKEENATLNEEIQKLKEEKESLEESVELTEACLEMTEKHAKIFAKKMHDHFTDGISYVLEYQKEGFAEK